jgi:hypothetical protein
LAGTKAGDVVTDDITGPEGLGDVQDIIDSATASLTGQGDLLKLLADTISVSGTFNPTITRMLGLQADSAAERTADATEATAKNTKKIAAEGALAFD